MKTNAFLAFAREIVSNMKEFPHCYGNVNIYCFVYLRWTASERTIFINMITKTRIANGSFQSSDKMNGMAWGM